ncbi:MAG: hypothetical protein K2K04_04275 [Clostridia bacterium]|nr:hypothetical protein [Clostridia bacterium]
MDKENFKKALACGLGRCYVALRDCADKAPYRELLLDCCLNNPCFDTQCEGTRAEYLYHLIKLYDDDGYFLSPITEKFNNPDEEYGWDFEHLCDLICEFAKDGNSQARGALEAMYGRLYTILWDKRDIDWYDFQRDNFERVCVNLVGIYGNGAFVRIAEDMDKLFIHNDNYSDLDFEFFYSLNEVKKPVERDGKTRLVREYAATKKVYDVDGLVKKLDGIVIDKDDESGWHEVVIDILNAYDGGAEIPKCALEFIYNNSLCSCCRYEAVKALNTRGWLCDDMLTECEFDSNGDVRKFIESIKSR